MNLLLEREAPAERLEPRPLRTVSRHDSGKSPSPCRQHSARLDEDVDPLLRTEPPDHTNAGTPQPREQCAEPQALHRIFVSGQPECRVVTDPDLVPVVVEEPHLLSGNDDNPVCAAEQPPVDPVVEACLTVFGRQPVKASHPLPR